MQTTHFCLTVQKLFRTYFPNISSISVQGGEAGCEGSVQDLTIVRHIRRYVSRRYVSQLRVLGYLLEANHGQQGQGLQEKQTNKQGRRPSHVYLQPPRAYLGADWRAKELAKPIS